MVPGLLISQSWDGKFNPGIAITAGMCVCAF